MNPQIPFFGEDEQAIFDNAVRGFSGTANAARVQMVEQTRAPRLVRRVRSHRFQMRTATNSSSLAREKGATPTRAKNRSLKINSHISLQYVYTHTSLF